MKNLEKKHIGILGGCGKMGKFLEKFFKRKGFFVLVSDLECGISPEELIKKSEVIFFSVPMEVFEKVVKEVSSFAREDQFFIDICSLKAEPVKIMKKYLKTGEILATHPLFGPFEKSLKNKKIAYFPVRGKNVVSWFKEVFEKEGVELIEIEPEEHDRIMAIVQVINHFWLVTLSKIIEKSGISIEKIVKLSTPSFEKQLKILKRLANQNENLYTRIQFDNPEGEKMRRIFLECVSELIEKCNQDEKEFKKEFLKAKEIAGKIGQLL